VHVRNIIMEEDHAKSRTAVTKRKAILSGKGKVIYGNYILTISEILNEITGVEKKTKKRMTTGAKKGSGK